MECKEIRVDVRTASIKESTEGQRQTKILFQINHTMPFTDEYNHLLKELFGNNLVHRFVNNYTNRVGCGFECAGIKTQA